MRRLAQLLVKYFMSAVQRKLDENNLFLEQDECCQCVNMWSLLHLLSLLVIHVLIKMSMSTDQFTIHRQIISNELSLSVTNFPIEHGCICTGRTKMASTFFT